MNPNRSAPPSAPVRRSFLVRLTNYRGIRSPSAIRNMMRAIVHWYGFTGWRFYR